MHTYRDEKGRYKTVGHDVEDFGAAIMRYGAVMEDTRRFVNAVERRLELDKGNTTPTDVNNILKSLTSLMSDDD